MDRWIEFVRAQSHPVLLFAGVAAVLLLATLISEWLRWRTRERPSAVIANLVARIRAWWVMVLLVGVAFALGRVGMIVQFALVSLFALREFITLAPTRRSDYYALLAAFYLALPLQYWLVYTDWYGLYTLLIPVYAFLLLPILSAVGEDTTRYLERTAKVQWGLMICVFCISHVPALINLKIPGYEGRNLLLVAFLVIVVQSSDVLQYIWGKLCGKRLIAPLIPGFKDLYPAIDVRLRLSDRRVDITAEGLDVAFLLGPLEDSNLRVRPIAECRRVLAASPDYIARRGMPRSGRDLVEDRHACLMLRYPGAREFIWTLVTPEGPRRFEVTGPFESDDGDVLTGWALAGRGIILKPVFEIAELLRSGELVSVAEETPPQEVRLAALFPHKRLQDPKIRLFIEHMVAACKKAVARLAA